MIRLVVLIVGLAVLVGAALALELDWGQVVLWLPPYQVEMSLQAAVLVLLALLVVTLVATRVLALVLDLPARIRRHRLRKVQAKRLKILSLAVTEYFDGSFVRSINSSKELLGDLDLARDAPAAIAAANAIAACAAHELHDSEQRAQFLEALKSGAGADKSVDPNLPALLEADFAVRDQQGERALAALAPMSKSDKRSIHSLRLALKAHQQCKNWDEVLRIARLLENRKALPSIAATRLKHAAARAWIDQGRHAQAIELIEVSLRKEWDSGLAMLYARAQGKSTEQLSFLEPWLLQHPQDPELHWALGRLCQREKLWGKARMHLEASLRAKPMAAAHVALAEIAESLSENETAAFHWKAAAVMTKA
jgi:HemY protein